MFVVPTILITSPLFEHDDRFLPRITVTRDESDIDQDDVEENILSMEILDDGEMNLMGSTIGESRSIFPDSLFDAARYDNKLFNPNGMVGVLIVPIFFRLLFLHEKSF